MTDCALCFLLGFGSAALLAGGAALVVRMIAREGR